LFPEFLENIREGLTGKEFAGDIVLTTKDLIFFCRIAPTVFENGRKGVSVFLDDITEQKRAEEQLEWSEEKYRSLIETTGTGYVILDKDGRVITANQEYVRFTGRSTLAEIERRPVTDWAAPYDLERNAREIELCFRNGQVRNLEIDYQKPDGTIQPIEINASVVQSDSGQIILTLCRDITERKRAEEALRDSEERYRQLVNISPDAVLIHQNGKINFLNPAALNLFGASHSDEITGKNILDFIHPDFHEVIRKNIEKDLMGNVTPPLEVIMLRLDGIPIIVEGRGVKTNIDGKPAIQVALKDITESKRSEKALRDSEEKYRSFIERANDIICIIQDGIVKMCNPRAAEFWGGPVEEILGRPFADLVHPDCLPALITRYNQRMAGENPPSIYETILIRKDGSKSFAEVNAGIISYEGKIADLVIVRDINERKKAEKALRESEATAHALMNAPTDSVILLDTKGIILTLNETAALRFGKRNDELVGVLVDDLLPEEVARSRRMLVAQVLEKKTMVRFVDERDGRWYDTVAYPIISGTGEVTRIAIIARDITDRKITERAFFQREQQF